MKTFRWERWWIDETATSAARGSRRNFCSLVRGGGAGCIRVPRWENGRVYGPRACGSYAGRARCVCACRKSQCAGPQGLLVRACLGAAGKQGGWTVREALIWSLVLARDRGETRLALTRSISPLGDRGRRTNCAQPGRPCRWRRASLSAVTLSKAERVDGLRLSQHRRR